ncbi:ricin-type beta-trefoil lectin domain protein [Streptomyces sp. BR123]|uniref:ricin-type beta-trefoil lectin domain protein n=1 Tax=Streptomyces sp. BR123 TaxID=2749828 RepID=UPI0015C45D91|nr:ricin-type beta-trefoil lectin domain protein [Streptomyces sp. BR123]NXY95189.1 ricin-type beta-trefoil lectin domain protein [Streptomyces sp. BR123]
MAIAELTTADRQTFANPSGTLSTDTSAVPERVKGQDGKWRTLDATLRAAADGAVVPTAVSSQLSFSGGGSGPMAAMTTADGKKVAFKAPFALPKPTLIGDSALYRNVLPDVDLRLTADRQGGWSQVLIVRTAQAAANPAVRKLRLDVEADGLAVSSDPAGNLEVKDTTGRTRFTSPTSFMWDSAAATSGPAAAGPSQRLSKSAGVDAPQASRASEAPPAPSSADGPGAGATVKPVRTTADGKGIDLVPDAELLNKGTGPWYIDPGWNPTIDNGNQAWAQVQEAYPDTNEFNGTEHGQDKPATGYCGYNIGNPPCTGIGRTRAYFQIGVDSRLYNTEVIGATFSATVISSSSPTTATPMGLYATGAIGNPTSWNRQPCGTRSTMQGCSKVGHTNMSGTGQIDFNVTDLVKNAVRYQWPTITVGLAPDDEYNKYHRQRYENTPHITVEYDITPTVWWPRTRPTPGFAGSASYADCRTPGTANPWDNPGWVGADNNVTLTTSTYSATKRQLWTAFQYWDDDNGRTYSAETGWNSDYGDVTVDVGPLIDGHQYGWTARTTDGTLTSAETAWCYLRVDRTPPTAAVTSADFPASGTIDAHPKRVGEEGTFTLSGTDPAPPGGGRSSGLACARWTTDPVKAAAVNWKCTDTDTGIAKLTDGKATIKLTPQQWGTNFLYFQTQDNAGNLSQPVAYGFYVPSNPNSPAPIFGDVTGDRKADILLPDSSGALRVIGSDADPAGAPSARPQLAPGWNGWNGIQTTHRGSLGDKNVDDLFAHQPGQPNLYIYRNSTTGGRLDGTAPVLVDKPGSCITPTGATVDCTTHGYGSDWSKATQIAAFGSLTGDTAQDGALGRTSLMFVESGRLWLATAGATNKLAPQAMLLSANDTRWDGYELITPGRAQGTDLPTLWARSKNDGTLHALPVKGTVQAPDLTAFKDPASGTIGGKVDPLRYPRAGSDGDLTGDGIPDLWAIDSDHQIVAFKGLGTAPNGNTVPHPTATGVDTVAILMGNLSMPTAQWKLTGQNGATTPDAVGTNHATAAGNVKIADPETIGGRATPYAAFDGKQSPATLTAARPAVDTRKSFTLSTWAKADAGGGVIASQDGNRASTFILYPDRSSARWQFALASADDNGWPFDYTGTTTDAARFTPDAWTQLTAVYDAGTGRMSLYVNGVLAASGIHRAATSPAPSGPLVLGRYKTDGAAQDHLKQGGISNFTVYPYAAAPTAPGATGPISLTASAGSCVDNDFDRAEDGNRIQISSCNGTGAQEFQIRGDGTIRTQGMCLNAANAGVANATLIELRTCDSAAPSQRFLPRADGSIHHPASGRCLDLGNFDTKPGTQLWLFDCNGSPAQRWTVPTLSTAPLPVPVSVS